MEKVDLKELVFYGPHLCQRKCGALICKAGNGAPDDIEFNYPEYPIYPSTQWEHHKCPFYKSKLPVDMLDDNKRVKIEIHEEDQKT